MYHPEHTNKEHTMASQIEHAPGSRPWLMKFQEDTFRNMMEMTRRKNNDYAGKGGDAFNNFSRVENLCPAITTEMGFFVRLTDKFSRVSSFVQNGELLVRDESAEDTLLDLSNYAFLFYAYLTAKKLKMNLQPTEPTQVEIAERFDPTKHLTKSQVDAAINTEAPRSIPEIYVERLKSRIRELEARNLVLEGSSEILGREYAKIADSQGDGVKFDTHSSMSEGNCNEDYTETKNGLEHN